MKRIVILRNVFSSVEGNGIITKKSGEWKEILENCGLDLEKGEEKTSGIFMMEYEAFLKHFRCLSVAEINDSYSYIYCKTEKLDPFGIYFTL